MLTRKRRETPVPGHVGAGVTRLSRRSCITATAAVVVLGVTTACTGPVAEEPRHLVTFEIVGPPAATVPHVFFTAGSGSGDLLQADTDFVLPWRKTRYVAQRADTLTVEMEIRTIGLESAFNRDLPVTCRIRMGDRVLGERTAPSWRSLEDAEPRDGRYGAHSFSCSTAAGWWKS